MNRYYDIFLSHSSQDKAYVKLLQDRLTKRGFYAVWYDETHIFWGDNLEITIEEGLRSSYYGIIVLSRHYLALSRWTAFEFERIINNGKIFIILHNITLDEIRIEYPIVHNIIREIRLIYSEPGLDYVLDQVNKIIGDSIIQQKQEFDKLRTLLVAREWIHADRETYTLVYKNYKLLKLPEENLNMLNRLWLIYSGERYGFSIQKEIYQQQSQGKNYLNNFKNFATCVGWTRKKHPELWESMLWTSESTPNAATQKGHFPALVYLYRSRFTLGARLRVYFLGGWLVISPIISISVLFLFGGPGVPSGGLIFLIVWVFLMFLSFAFFAPYCLSRNIEKSQAETMNKFFSNSRL